MTSNSGWLTATLCSDSPCRRTTTPCTDAPLRQPRWSRWEWTKQILLTTPAVAIFAVLALLAAPFTGLCCLFERQEPRYTAVKSPPDS